MSLVIDATLAVAWYFDDEATPDADELLDQVADTGALVPATWRLEVANAFEIAVRRQRVDAIYRDASLTELALLPIAVDDDTNTYAWSTTLRLADRFSLPTFAAAYLELAQRRSLPLATLDLDLRAAAPALQIKLLPVATSQSRSLAAQPGRRNEGSIPVTS